MEQVIPGAVSAIRKVAQRRDFSVFRRTFPSEFRLHSRPQKIGFR